MRVLLAFALCVMSAATCICQELPDPVGHYTFEEGQGAVTLNQAGRANNGTLYGAQWVRGPLGGAAQLDGVDDYIDLGMAEGLLPGAAYSISLWVKLTGRQGGIISCASGGGWGDQRLVLAYNTYSGAPSLIWVLADGHMYQQGPLPEPPLDTWAHLAMTLTGRKGVFYLDGSVIGTISYTVTPEVTGIPLLIGACQGLGKPFLPGMVDEVAVYPEALTPVQVGMLYKQHAEAFGKNAADFTGPAITTTASAQSGRLLVKAEYGLMRPLPEGTVFAVRVSRDGVDAPIAEADIAADNTHSWRETIIDLQQQPPGRLSVTVEGRGADGAAVGRARTREVTWPEMDPRFSPQRGVKVLNNLVFELLNADPATNLGYTIHNPREGWVYVKLTPPRLDDGPRKMMPKLSVDGEEVPLQPAGNGAFEAMRYLPEGEHTVGHRGTAGAWKLEVRAIGELFYSMYGANPLVPETGDYTWEWLNKHCLPHYNTIIGRGSDDQEPQVQEWTAMGRQWMTQRHLPWVETADEAYTFWTEVPGFQHPKMSGIWADEFSSGQKYVDMYPIWCEALRKMKANPAFDGKRFYAFMGMTYGDGYDELTRTIMECDYRLGPEWYLREVPAEADLEAYFGPQWERDNRARYAAAAPEAELNRVVVLGLLSQPEESCDIHPHIDYNVYLDRQFEFIANDPAFFGTRGLQGYYSPYAGEEQTRLFAALVRHYAIEGNTGRMLSDPYELPHLKNPDFTRGIDGWKLTPAVAKMVVDGAATRPEPVSMGAKVARGFGWLQGRYDSGGVGDTVLWTKRSATTPNVFSQTATGLQPGRLYSLRFFTGNYQDYLNGVSRAVTNAISVRLPGAELVPDRCWDAQIKSNYAHTFEAFDRNNPYRLNYHQRVFRATSETMEVGFSDWASDDAPGGAADEELIWGFMQLQPYFEE